jgi:hypothetical protein
MALSGELIGPSTFEKIKAVEEVTLWFCCSNLPLLNRAFLSHQREKIAHEKIEHRLNCCSRRSAQEMSGDGNDASLVSSATLHKALRTDVSRSPRTLRYRS